MSEWVLYFILKLDAITEVCWFIVVVSMSSCLGYIIMRICISSPWADERSNDEYDRDWPKRCKDHLRRLCLYFRWSIPVIIISLFFLTALPSTNQMILIYVVPKVVNNEHVQALPNEALRLFRDKIQAWTDKTEKVLLDEIRAGKK